ncbi:MAG: hypothetical protein JST67_07055 [Bacteroidetes bacterium]|nr:hypothetical protein [Bacteroidota bacterium]
MKRVFFICFLIFCTSFCSCSQKKYIQQGYEAALVIENNTEGCPFLIETGDTLKKKWLPNLLPDAVKKNKQKIWIKYHIQKKQLPSICMVGKQIEVLDIKKRK